MNRRINIALSFAAGVLGGLLSHYIVAKPVLAQSLVVPPKEISAQTFILANDKGVPYGLFGFDADGNATIRLQDRSGKVVWSTVRGGLQPLASNISK